MFANHPRKAVAVAAILVMSMPQVGGAQYGGIPATEYVLLPKFCWSQFDGGLKGSEFTILNCGGGMNHYCYGLVDLQRLKKAKDAYLRRVLLNSARSHMLYTTTAMKSSGTMATCPISPHVEATVREIELKFKIYGIK